MLFSADQRCEMSHGDKSGLYGGCSNTVYRNFASVFCVRAAVCGRTLSCSKNTPGQQDTLFVCFYCFMQTVQSIDHLTMVQKLKKKQFFLLEKPCQHDFATTLHYLGCLWQ